MDWAKQQCYVMMVTPEQFNDKSEVTASPNSLFFCVLTPQKIGSQFEIFAVEEKNKSASCSSLYKLQGHTMKHVLFNPFSTALVLYNEQKVWFCEIKQVNKRPQFKLIREIEHRVSANSVFWSGCGRFVCFGSMTSSTYNLHMFDFIGRQVHREYLRDIKHFVIKPSSMAKQVSLTAKDQEELDRAVAANFNAFVDQDRKLRKKKKLDVEEGASQSFSRLVEYLRKKKELWESLSELRMAAEHNQEEDATEWAKVVRIDKDEVLEEIEDHK